MPILRVYDHWECHDLAGKQHSDGFRSSPIEITIDGYVDHDTISLATATNLTVWNSAEALTDFDFFWLKADQDLKIELTVDRGGEVGSEEIVFVHPANKPFRLIYDDALANYSGTLSGGTADVIDEIVIRNESGTAATIRRAIIT